MIMLLPLFLLACVVAFSILVVIMKSLRAEAALLLAPGLMRSDHFPVYWLIKIFSFLLLFKSLDIVYDRYKGPRMFLSDLLVIPSYGYDRDGLQACGISVCTGVIVVILLSAFSTVHLGKNWIRFAGINLLQAIFGWCMYAAITS